MIDGGLLGDPGSFAGEQGHGNLVSAVGRVIGCRRRRASLTNRCTRTSNPAGRERQVQEQQAQKQGGDVTFHD